MTAPALVLLGYGSADPRVARVSRQIRTRLLRARPNLEVEVAFLDHCAPSAPQVVAELAARGVREVVLVPLLLSDAFHAQVEVPSVVAAVSAAHPELRVTASRPIGPEAALLTVIDRRLRDALRARRIGELDGLVFAAAGSTDVRSNAIVARRARQWATHHRLPCVTAFAIASGPTTAEAVRTLRSQGRRHVAVGSWFLAPGALFTRQAELAYEAGAVAVSEPMGAEPEIADVALVRYVVAALELVDLDTPAAGTDLDSPFEVETGYEDEPPLRHLSVVSA